MNTKLQNSASTYIARNTNIGPQVSETSEQTQAAIKNNFFLQSHEEIFKGLEFNIDFNFNSSPEIPEGSTLVLRG